MQDDRFDEFDLDKASEKTQEDLSTLENLVNKFNNFKSNFFDNKENDAKEFGQKTEELDKEFETSSENLQKESKEILGFLKKMKSYSKIKDPKYFKESETYRKIDNAIDSVNSKVQKFNSKYSQYFTEFGANFALPKAKERIKKLSAEIEKLSSTPGLESLKDFSEKYKFVNEDYLKLYTRQDSVRVLKALQSFYAITRDYQNKASKFNSYGNLDFKTKFNSTIDNYLKIFDNVNSGMETLKNLNDFNFDALNKEFEKSYQNFENEIQESNLGFAHQRDLEVVEALEMTGVSLKREKNANGKTVWAIDYEKTKENNNALEYLDQNNVRQKQTINLEQVNAFLDQYLNKSVSERNNAVITSKGIFKLYLEQVKEQSDKGCLFSVQNKLYNDAIKQVEEKYNEHSMEWQDFKLYSNRQAVIEGLKLGLADVYKNSISNELEKDCQKELEEIKDAKITLDAVSNVRLNRLSKLISCADKFNLYSNNVEQVNYSQIEDINNKYLEKQKELETNFADENLSVEEKQKIESQLEKINLSIQTIRLTRLFAGSVALDYANNMQDENKKDAYAKLINNLGEYDFLSVEKSGDENKLVLNENIKTLSPEIKALCNATIKDIESISLTTQSEELSEEANVNNENEETVSQEYTDHELFIDILANSTMDANVNRVGDDLKNASMYEFASKLIASGETPFNDLIGKFREAKALDPDNENLKDFKTFAQSQAQKENFDVEMFLPIANLDCISDIEALTRDGSQEYKQTNEFKNAKKNFEDIRSKADIWYLILAKISNNLKNSYAQLTKDSLDSSMLNKEYNNVVSSYARAQDKSDFFTEEDKLSASAYKKMFDKDYVKNLFNECAENDYLKSDDKLTDNLLNVVGNYLEDEEVKNLLKDKENSEKQDDSKKEESKQKLMKFSEKYPKDKFQEMLKKFKPYCAKSTGKIIDKLLKMIEGCNIIIVEKTKKFDPTSNVRTPDKVSTTDSFVDKKPEINLKDNENNEEKLDVEKLKELFGSTQNTNQNETQPNVDNRTNIKPEIQSREPETQSKDNLQGTYFKESEGKQTQESQNKTENNETRKMDEIKNNMDAKSNSSNKINITDGQFATYKILSLGLNATLRGKAFEQNRGLLSEGEKKKLQALSNVMDYITSESKFEEGTIEYNEDLRLKEQLAEEIDLKSKTNNYNPGITQNNLDYYLNEFPNVQSYIFKDINYVMQNCRNLEDIGQIVGITTDRSLDNPEMGNLLTKEEIESITNCKDNAELWEYIKSNKKLYDNGIWNVPAMYSSELNNILKNAMENELSQIE